MIAYFLWFLLALANAYSDPGACSGDCWAHDPGLIQRESDGKYFRFSTGDGILIITADNIEGPWTSAGYVLPDGSSITDSGGDATNLWAPDLHYADGTYYLYYVVSKLGTRESAIGVATSTTLESGSWTDHGSTGLTSDNSSSYNAIDPNWITIGSTQYVTFGSYWDGLFQVEFSSALTIDSGASAVNLEYNSTGNHWEEASYVFQYDGYYYLFFSSGRAQNYDTNKPIAGNEYKIFVCRSETGTGGYVDASGTACTANGGTLVLETHDYVYGPGGQGVLNDKTYGPVLYYHYADTNIGLSVDEYQFGWNNITWTNGWPTV